MLPLACGHAVDPGMNIGSSRPWERPCGQLVRGHAL